MRLPPRLRSPDWAKTRAELNAARVAPNVESLDSALTVLDAMMGRVISARERLDGRCAAIPALIGAVAGLVAGRLSPNVDGATALVGLAAGASAIVAVAAAVAALAALRYAVGPDAVQLARNTHLPTVDLKQATANQLAVGIAQLTRMIHMKGMLLNVSLTMTAVAGLLLVVFTALGGIR